MINDLFGCSVDRAKSLMISCFAKTSCSRSSFCKHVVFIASNFQVKEQSLLPRNKPQMSEEAHDDTSSAYDNSHRAFLQAFFARSVLTYEDAKPILAAILSAHGM